MMSDIEEKKMKYEVYDMKEMQKRELARNKIQDTKKII